MFYMKDLGWLSQNSFLVLKKKKNKWTGYFFREIFYLQGQHSH